MTTTIQSNICSICRTSTAERLCIGCGIYFCPKDFQKHEQQLTIKFDYEIIKSHEELIQLIENLDKSNHILEDLTDRIDQWKKSTIEKVENAATKAHHELRELINKERQPIIEQLKPITKEIDDNDIDRLKQQINDMKQKLEQSIRNDTKKVILIDNDQIDWNRIIYAQDQQTCEYF
jgi:flagellar biosynthesis GTPase FlhF